MRIKISIAYIIGFLLLTIIMLELHEMVHISVGRLICGCWGTRDFNVWQLCEDCDKNHSLSWLATLAGPLFSFSMMWLGMFLLSSSSPNRKAIGFSLIFANIPFGRISEIMKGAGDEMVVTRHLLKGHAGSTQAILVCLLFVLLLGLPPVIKAYRAMINKRSWIYLVGFLTLPIVFILVYILIGMNGLLHSGFLSGIVVMGTPLLITLHTIVAICLLLLVRKNLFQLRNNG